MSDEMDEIWALYLDDGTQSLDQMESALLALQNADPSAAGEHVSALFRAVHTFKGNSRVLGLSTVESRAHYSEDLIGLVRDEGVPLDEEIIDILLLASDVLRDMLEQTSANRADVDPAESEELLFKLKDKIARAKGEPGAAPAEAAPAPAPEAASEPEPEPVAEAEPEVVAEPEPEPEPEPEVAEEPESEVVAEEPAEEPVAETSAAAADPVAADTRPVQSVSKRLIDDPSYRDIFKGMADGSVAKFRKFMVAYADDVSGTYAAAKREADNLNHAAGQMGLTEWSETLKTFMGEPEADSDTGVEMLAALILRLEELTKLDLTDEVVTELQSGEGTFFDRLQEPLSFLSAAGMNWAVGEKPDMDELRENAEEIKEIADSRGLIRVADAAGRIAEAQSPKDYRNAELRLYEELSAVERVLTEEAAASNVSPSQLLRSWCAGHVFDTLAAMDAAIIGLKKGIDLDAQYSSFARQMRLIFHACVYHNLDTAGQLAMSLIDLFGRVQTSGHSPDSILMHIARGFIDTIELVFDALEQGEIPDTQNLDILFEQASNAAFTSEGLMTATAIERRLNLPEEFHRVLSPESVRSASAAIEKGHHFYIIRTDINDKEDLAEKFLEWISADNVKSITNVTVFRGGDTLFDFLVSTPMDQTDLVSSLTEMDSTGKYLFVTATLEDTQREDAPGGAAPAGAEGEQSMGQGPGLPAEMLESISEVAASQAMVNHMLNDLSGAGLLEAVDSLLKGAEGNPHQCRDAIRKVVTDFTARLQEVAQVEAQLVSQMSHLQEQTVAIRSRPLEMLIRPLEALVETLSRRGKREAKLTSSGGQMTMDITLMEHLRKMLRTLLTLRLADADTAPNTLHMTFHRDEERVMVTLEDDGADADEYHIQSELQSILTSTSSELRQIHLPGGKGMRFHISMPLAMVVLEGMVVGVDGIRYVIPVDAIQTIVQPPSSALRPISAADGRMMLRMEDGTMVNVHCLNNRQVSTLDKLDASGKRRVFVILSSNDKTMAIPVDELMGQQLVLLRPLRGVLKYMRNLNGIALLAGGEVGMVLSTNALVAEVAEAA